jgi:phosphatidylserine/phosphatidylglycerophosphate/cardiolipin synthase-like enzyme
MAWNMKWDLVTKAEKTIDFSYFSIERDAYGYAYLGALLAKQMQGVQVTGVTDYMANRGGHGFTGTLQGADYMQELAQYGAKIGIYDTLGTRAKSIAEDGLTYKAISSDHDKLCVIDAGTPHAEGETGGRNVAGAYHQDPKDNPKSWRDDSIQLKGPVTDGLKTALYRELNGPAVTMVKPDLINMDSHATALLAASQLMDTWIKSPPLSDAEKAAVRADPKKKEALADQLVEQALQNLKAMPGIPDKVKNADLSDSEQADVKKWAMELANDLELKGSRAKYDTLGGYTNAEVKILDQVGSASAAPGQRFNELGPDFFHLIKGAQKEIVIQNPYVVLTEPMVQALEDASKRGVKVTIVTNSPESTDSAVTQGFFLNDWKDFEARVPSAKVLVATGERKFHAKAFVLDGKVSGDTSYNADLLSGLVNGEVGAVTKSEAVASNLMGHIYDDLADPANKFKEWTIQRDAQGNPVLGADGHPVAIEGPEQDVSARLQARYKPVQYLCDLLTKTSLGAPLAHPGLGAIGR